jgi:hypothetical protein
LGEYDKYPVRNGYGHIEYLTAREIEGLREMGELGEVLSDRPASRRPPTAKNPANQAEVNRLFYEKEQKRRGGGRGNSRWTPAGSQPPDVGVVAGTDHVVSFKTRDDQDRTIIADGDYSDDNKGFRRRHNDYGRKREGGGYFSEDRGDYTGPDH